jgi:hypothetical protein
VERRRLRAAVDRDMGVIAYEYYPKNFHGSGGGGVSAPKTNGWVRPKGAPASAPLAGAGTYAFLNRTRGWTPEEICLAHALTEPSLSSVQVSADRAERVEALAAIPEREMPPGVSAQIEMARFSSVAPERMARGA